MKTICELKTKRDNESRNDRKGGGGIGQASGRWLHRSDKKKLKKSDKPSVGERLQNKKLQIDQGRVEVQPKS